MAASAGTSRTDLAAEYHGYGISETVDQEVLNSRPEYIVDDIVLDVREILCDQATEEFLNTIALAGLSLHNRTIDALRFLFLLNGLLFLTGLVAVRFEFVCLWFSSL